MSGTSPLHLFQGYGIELEYMVVDAAGLSVLPVTDRILHAVAGEYVSEVERGAVAWSNELALHVIELKTNGPAPVLEGLPAAFNAHVAQVNALLGPMGGRLMPGAMHPWMDPDRELRLWPHDYSPIYQSYDRIFDCRGHGWANLQSVHLNLPFADDGEFARLHAAVRLLLPIMPALAASSPVLEGRATGLMDNRLDVYGTNSRRVPSITGQIVPEPVFSRHDYETAILQRMYRDIAPYDPEGLFRHEWLNSRGAIARFDRSAIEIRVLDVQECPLADVAVCAAIVGVLKALVEEWWLDLPGQQAWTTDELAAILRASIAAADEAVIDDRRYPAALGWRAARPCTAGLLWRHLLDQVGADLSAYAWRDPLRIILEHGPLARRILHALGPEPSRVRLREVYGALCDCLAGGRMFLGRD